VEDDVHHCDKIHDSEDGRDSIETVCVLPLVGSNADQHEGNAHLNGNNGGAIEHFEEEEKLRDSVSIDSVDDRSAGLPASLGFYLLSLTSTDGHRFR
jgi:hypothetical protein